MAKLAIIGAGAWGTTLGVLAAQNSHDVMILGRDAVRMDRYNATNRNLAYLEDFILPETLQFTAEPEEALGECEAVLIAIPSEHVRTGLAPFASLLGDRKIPICSSVKGFLDDQLLRVSEALPDILGAHPFATLSGPNLAKEVLRGDPAVTVIASTEEETIETFRGIFGRPTFRIYGSHDVIGVELGGAVKNILAIASGIAMELGYGMNTQSALVTRGIAELTTLGGHLGAEPVTLLGIAGLGDAIATCLSPLSRNVQLGGALARGLPLETALLTVTGVAEGAHTAKHVAAFAAIHQLDLPITTSVAAVVSGTQTVEASLQSLLARTWKMEVW